MDEWIQRANLAVFRQLIAAEEDEARRHEIERLLDEQEARIESAMADRLTYCATEKANEKV